MITEKERRFSVYWEQERQRQGTTLAKILNGLPMAIMFSLPVLLLIIAVRLFLPDWYSKISDVSNGSIVAAVVALFICVLFFSYFRMHYKWEMNEQLYRELMARTDRPETT